MIPRPEQLNDFPCHLSSKLLGHLPNLPLLPNPLILSSILKTIAPFSSLNSEGNLIAYGVSPESLPYPRATVSFPATAFLHKLELSTCPLSSLSFVWPAFPASSFCSCSFLPSFFPPVKINECLQSSAQMLAGPSSLLWFSQFNYWFLASPQCPFADCSCDNGCILLWLCLVFIVLALSLNSQPWKT